MDRKWMYAFWGMAAFSLLWALLASYTHLWLSLIGMLFFTIVSTVKAVGYKTKITTEEASTNIFNNIQKIKYTDKED